MTFINWVHTAALVDFYNNTDQVILDSFEQNPEWTLVKNAVYSGHMKLKFSEETYPVTGFSLTLKRVPTYYVYNVIAPVLLLTLLSCLVYVMPAEAGEKVGLQITILLSFSVMLLIMADVTPRAGKTTPQISMCLCHVCTVLCVDYFGQSQYKQVYCRNTTTSHEIFSSIMNHCFCPITVATQAFFADMVKSLNLE